MARPANTQITLETLGIREDLTDMIYDISPEETPLTTGMARIKAKATTHEWQTDVLAAAASNPKPEGDDATADAHVATVRPNNITQIFRKVVSVSGTQRAVNTAGREDEFDYQIAKRGREMKRDIEFTVINNQVKATVTTTATSRQLGALENWLTTNTAHLATSTTPGQGATITEGTAVTITTTTQLKNALDTVIQQVWTSGGDASMIMASGAVKVALSRISGIATLYKDVPKSQQAQIVAGADAYVSDFGNHMIVPNRFQNTDTIFVVDKEYLALAELRPIRTEPLAKTGDSDRAMLIGELTLEVRNEAACGKVADISTIALT